MQKMGIHSEDMATCLRSTLLGACSPALLLEIMTSSKAVYDHFPAGTVVYDPGHFKRCLGVVLEGELQVTKGELSDRIVRLDDFLDRFGWRELTFAIELKVPDTEEDVAALLREYRAEEKAVITSFSFENVCRMREIAPRLRCGFLCMTQVLSLHISFHFTCFFCRRMLEYS